KPWPNEHRTSGDTKWRCRITTPQSFSGATHIFAARVKVHTTTGHLSSFWVNGTQNGAEFNEIDVFENEGRQSQTCRGSASVPVNSSNFYGINHAFYSKYAPEKVGKKHCLGQAKTNSLYGNSNEGDLHT